MATKTSKAASAVKLKGGILPKGEASAIKRAFNTRMQNAGAINLPELPDAACLSVKELRAFLDVVEKVVNPDPSKPVPENEIGVAIMPAFRKNKITIMLVATRFKENKLTQKVTAINNPVTGIHRGTEKLLSKTAKSTKSKLIGDGEKDSDEPPVDEYAMDTLGLWPS